MHGKESGPVWQDLELEVELLGIKRLEKKGGTYQIMEMLNCHREFRLYPQGNEESLKGFR